ncbi:MAG: exo-alpha-sialidase [Armatimonadetes bacterium]|nr:exo-alpha-sialidase [Armatimonadota bacterium]
MHRADFPFMHARPFVAGDRLYVLGHCGDLMIMRSDDWGETWGEPATLTSGQQWHQAPCNVLYAHGKVYLVMERNVAPDAIQGWPVQVLAPVVMAAKVDHDLTRRTAWVFSKELSFREVLQLYGPPNLVGVPFFDVGDTAPHNLTDKRTMHPIGWLETNIVQIHDPGHIWYDRAGRTYHLLARAHTGSVNMGCLAKAIEDQGGNITVGLERAPSGAPMLYVPLPGGQMKFHVLYDDATKLYWLLSSQSTDSMTRPELLPANRFNLPNNERHRLQLHFSKNLVDWCFACLVAKTDDPKQSRHYASMVIDGADLHILSRSGDANAKNSHDGNMITFHTVRDFRRLVY